MIDLKKDADPDVVLNQLYKFSPLQDSFSIILLALVDGKPRTLSLKEMLQEFVRHRVTVHPPADAVPARPRPASGSTRSQGLLLAHANIDEVIRVIRASKTQAEAKERLMRDQDARPPCCSGRWATTASPQFQEERGVADEYSLTPVQADAILQDDARPAGQSGAGKARRRAHQAAGARSASTCASWPTSQNIYAMIRDDCEELARKHADARRTELSGEEIGEVDLEDLIEEETMVVSISHNGYIKRTPASVYRAQRRGGKGIKGAKADEDDPVEHLFVTSTHDYLLFFTNKGKVYWQKVYNLPQLSPREQRPGGREPAEPGRGRKDRRLPRRPRLRPAGPLPDDGHAQGPGEKDRAQGLQPAAQERHHRHQAQRGRRAGRRARSPSRATKSCSPPPTAWRSASTKPTPARWAATPAASKASRSPRTITLVGMVVADPDATLLTACATRLRQTHALRPERRSRDEGETAADEDDGADSPRLRRGFRRRSRRRRRPPRFRYRTQHRGGKGLRDIKTTERNGPVIGIVRVNDDDELMMMTARGKIQRVEVSDFNPIGRNTQGVRIMSLDEGDTLAAIVRVPQEEREETANSRSEMRIERSCSMTAMRQA